MRIKALRHSWSHQPLREGRIRVSGKDPLKMKVNDSELVGAGHSGPSDSSVRVGPDRGQAASCPHAVPFDGGPVLPFSSLGVLSGGPGAAFPLSRVADQLWSFTHSCCGGDRDVVQSPPHCPVPCSRVPQHSACLSLRLSALLLQTNSFSKQSGSVTMRGQA